ncbi:MAG: DUF1194 domain-containing protein [Alphaproteobacteria bacterium]
MRAFRPILAAALLTGLAGGPAAAAEAVDLELVLAADGSGSIDDAELALQREGYGAALMHPDVQGAIRSGMLGRIAVAYVEWGAAHSQHVIADWTIIDGPVAAAAFAETLRTTPRAAVGYNSIANAIDFARNIIETNDIEGTRKVIDVSADAGNYGGRPLAVTRAEALADGITINGLAIARQGSTRPYQGMPLEDHFRNDIIGGPGAFVITAGREVTFSDAVLKKLVLEIAGDVPAAGQLGALAAE